jgi:hypothetical protein
MVVIEDRCINKYLACFEVEWIEYSGRVDDVVDFGDVVRFCSIERRFPLMMGDVFRKSQQSFVSNEVFK